AGRRWRSLREVAVEQGEEAGCEQGCGEEVGRRWRSLREAAVEQGEEAGCEQGAGWRAGVRGAGVDAAEGPEPAAPRERVRERERESPRERKSPPFFTDVGPFLWGSRRGLFSWASVVVRGGRRGPERRVLEHSAGSRAEAWGRSFFCFFCLYT